MKLKSALIILAVIGQLILYSTSAQAHPATGIVVDSAGNIYFSDLETIWKFSTEGKLTVFRAGQSGRHVHELSIDQLDNVYGADVSYNPAKKGWPTNVWKMTPEGKFAYLLATTEHPPSGWSIWRDQAGNMYSVDQNNHTKRETLLLRRTPDGTVGTFAGSAYGHADGKGALAKFSSVGGMAFGPDGSLYLTDGATIRKVTFDGSVTTVAKDLTFRTSADKPRLFADSGGLTGLTIDAGGNVYAADAGNRRLIKVKSTGEVEIILRTEPPYFPNGVAASGGNLYVLEVGFTLFGAWSGPRVRKIGPDGRSSILTTVGAQGSEGNWRSAFATEAGVATESALAFLYNDGRMKYSIGLFLGSLLTFLTVFWRRRRRNA
ncbi:MAG: hypothetical protein ACREBG_29215 [Pyrinomonadaceae bacterium]